MMSIAILGWGSLLWDKYIEFDKQLDSWQFDGPNLKLEFSRVSETRNGALTLVLDIKNGKHCQVAYALSKHKDPYNAICDLRCREETKLENIGLYFADNSRKQAREEEVFKTVQNWASKKKIDVVIWTDLASNFQEKSQCKQSFSIEAAFCHLQTLDSNGKANAVEYVRRAPAFIVTPLRDALLSQPWFQ